LSSYDPYLSLKHKIRFSKEKRSLSDALTDALVFILKAMSLKSKKFRDKNLKM
jgi:hypothetical protein